jgi:hypothetical protein
MDIEDRGLVQKEKPSFQVIPNWTLTEAGMNLKTCLAADQSAAVARGRGIVNRRRRLRCSHWYRRPQFRMPPFARAIVASPPNRNVLLVHRKKVGAPLTFVAKCGHPVHGSFKRYMEPLPRRAAIVLARLRKVTS